jgi:thiamine biosynthesis protein ThiI
VTGAVTDLPVHRPLLSMDKSAVSERARAIGTYDDSTIDTGCHRLATDRAATHPPLERVEAAEPAGIDELAREAAAERSLFD